MWDPSNSQHHSRWRLPGKHRSALLLNEPEPNLDHRVLKGCPQRPDQDLFVPWFRYCLPRHPVEDPAGLPPACKILALKMRSMRLRGRWSHCFLARNTTARRYQGYYYYQRQSACHLHQIPSDTDPTRCQHCWRTPTNRSNKHDRLRLPASPHLYRLGSQFRPLERHRDRPRRLRPKALTGSHRAAQGSPKPGTPRCRNDQNFEPLRNKDHPDPA